MFNEDHRLTLNLGFQVNSVTQEGNASLRKGDKTKCDKLSYSA